MYTMYNTYCGGLPAWMMRQFRDPQKWLSDLEKALAGEKEAIEFYGTLESIAPNDEARRQVDKARQDEMKHFRMFSELYVRLTGRQPVVPKPVFETPDFSSGVYKSFNDELDAMDLYRDMMLSTNNLVIRDIMFEAMTDEMEHAERFTMILASGLAPQPFPGQPK